MELKYLFVAHTIGVYIEKTVCPVRKGYVGEGYRALNKVQRVPKKKIEGESFTCPG